MVSLDDDPVKRNPNAPLIVVEFFDFNVIFVLGFTSKLISN